MIKGKNCPIDYRITEEDYNQKIIEADSVYIIGGLYGNMYALKRIKEIQSHEEKMTGNKPKLIFNGDIHWFDYKVSDFMYIENETREDLKLLGNVEAELVRVDDIGAGCGCSYPDYVPLDTVKRSNEIHNKLKQMFSENRDRFQSISNRKKICIVKVGNAKVLITHGDEKSLSGWNCSRESLKRTKRQEEIYNFMNSRNIDILASSHTCEQVILDFNKKVVLNNGASGMPSLPDSSSGIITRIAKTQTKNPLFSRSIKGVFAEQIRVNFDSENFIKWFDENYLEDSAAAISYRDRIVNGARDKFCIIKSFLF